MLAEGYTSGGGVDGPGAFSFAIEYETAERQVAQLEVFEVDASDGHEVSLNVVPLVLARGLPVRQRPEAPPH